MIVKLNNEKNGVELHFTGKPDASTLSTIKAAGFRWGGAKLGFWYAKQTPERLALAQQLSAGAPAEIHTTQKAAGKAAKAVKPTYEMKYTFGGYRDATGKYTSCRWSLCLNFANGAHAYEIEAMTDNYGPVPTPQGAKFQNNSDSMTDYFEHSSWFISPACPDFLGVLEAYEKQKAHDAAKRAKREEKHGGPETREQRIAYLQRLMGYTYEKAEQSVKRDEDAKAEQERRRFEYVAECRRLGEKFAAARASGDSEKLEAARQDMVASVEACQNRQQEKEREQSRACNLQTVESARKRGECVELNGVAFILNESTYHEMFANKVTHVYTLIAIDATTGDRIFGGELNSEEDRRKKMSEIVNNRTA